MKKRTSIILILTCICVTFLIHTFAFKNISSIVYADDSGVQIKIKSLESDLSQIEKQRAEAQRKLNAARSTKATQMTLKRQYDDEIAAIQLQMNTTEELINQYEAGIAETQAEIDTLRVEQKEQIKSFDEMVRMSFMYGSDDYLTMIFESESFSDFLSRLDMISYLLSYNQSVVDNMKEVEDRLVTSEQSLISSKQNLESYLESKEQLKADYMSKSKESADLIVSLTANEAQAAEALKVIEESKKKLENDIAQLAKQLNDGGKYSGGVFIWPVNTKTQTSSGWEWRINPISKKKEFHNGLDIPAPRGTHIYAAAAGTVVKCEWYGGYGNCVIINHGGGVMTLYGHCNALNVKNGQSVKQGDVIAFVGSTGYSTGNHLHFTVYENGNTAVNPWNYLK